MNIKSEEVSFQQEQAYDNEEESPQTSLESSAASLAQATENTQASNRSNSTPSPVQGSARKRKKPPKPGDATDDLLEQVISIQNKSDKKMISLEENRIKIKERQMESEAQQRREEREFQMEMFRIMMMMCPGVHPPPPHQPSLPNPGSSSSPGFPFGNEGTSYPYSQPFSED